MEVSLDNAGLTCRGRVVALRFWVGDRLFIGGDGDWCNTIMVID